MCSTSDQGLELHQARRFLEAIVIAPILTRVRSVSEALAARVHVARRVIRSVAEVGALCAVLAGMLTVDHLGDLLVNAEIAAGAETAADHRPLLDAGKGGRVKLSVHAVQPFRDCFIAIAALRGADAARLDLVAFLAWPQRGDVGDVCRWWAKSERWQRPVIHGELRQVQVLLVRRSQLFCYDAAFGVKVDHRSKAVILPRSEILHGRTQVSHPIAMRLLVSGRPSPQAPGNRSKVVTGSRLCQEVLVGAHDLPGEVAPAGIHRTPELKEVEETPVNFAIAWPEWNDNLPEGLHALLACVVHDPDDIRDPSGLKAVLELPPHCLVLGYRAVGGLASGTVAALARVSVTHADVAVDVWLVAYRDHHRCRQELLDDLDEIINHAVVRTRTGLRPVVWLMADPNDSAHGRKVINGLLHLLAPPEVAVKVGLALVGLETVVRSGASPRSRRRYEFGVHVGRQRCLQPCLRGEEAGADRSAREGPRRHVAQVTAERLHVRSIALGALRRACASGGNH
mmetsp:Transcript_32665/g.71342  ORF Transcript_32665/g.71342 Transcript_32665/m.71342 type:complete len:512 (-) Transcript_32665:2007-3542(-)